MLRGVLKAAVLVGAIGVETGKAPADHSAQFDTWLRQGKLNEAQEELADVVQKHPGDHQAKLALGIAAFLQAVEGLAADQYRYGLLNQHAQSIPILRLPVPKNPDPAEISHEQFRKIITDFGARLQQAEAALAAVDTQNVKLTVYPGRIRLDLNCDGVASDDESFWKLFAAVNRGVQEGQGEAFAIGFDGADVHWLRGYCHVLMAFCDLALAYDGREWFERCGHLLYPRVKSPYTFLEHNSTVGFNPQTIADIIAAIHLLNFPLLDADRMRTSHEHLLAMVSQSRRCWERALAETDDDREWIPNPNQEGVVGLRVSREIIDGWHAVLDEVELVLNGEKLIPFWRIYAANTFGGRPAQIPDTGTGVNLKRVFTEPRDLDVVLFVTGTGAAPYLEEGPFTTPETWRRLRGVFRGQFFGFAIWFN